MSRPLNPRTGNTGHLARAHEIHALRTQLEDGVQMGRGISRTTRGTFTRRERPARKSFFTGNVRVDGVLFVGLNSDGSKPYVIADVSVPSAWESATALPEPNPPNQECYIKANTYGDIHADRF